MSIEPTPYLFYFCLFLACGKNGVLEATIKIIKNLVMIDLFSALDFEIVFSGQKLSRIDLDLNGLHRQS